MKVYISGKVTNNPSYMEDFMKAEEHLVSLGHQVVNPVRVNAELPKDSTWEQYMDMSLQMLKMCDAVYMLENWMDSYGATIEWIWAKGTGKSIMRQHSENKRRRKKETHVQDYAEKQEDVRLDE